MGKVSADIYKKQFENKPIFNKKSLKTKIKSDGDEVTDFYSKEIPKVNFNHSCLATISLDSFLKKDENCHPAVSLKECKYIETKVIRLINGDLSQ